MTGSRRTLCRAVLAGWTFTHVLCTPALAQAPAADEARASSRRPTSTSIPMITMDVTRKVFINTDPKATVPSADRQTGSSTSALSRPPRKGRGPSQLRYALLERLARPDARADDRIHGRYRRALFHAADAGHVDQRVRGAGQAHQRHGGRELRDRAARVERKAARRRQPHRRADTACVDHRAHPDQRRQGLSGRAQDPGRLPDHGARRLGQGTVQGRAEDRPERRHEDATAAAGQRHVGHRVLQARRGADEAEPAAHHRLVDHRSHEADRARARQELRLPPRSAPTRWRAAPPTA